MKYEVKGLTSYGVYDGDRLCGTYESEKAATLVAEALNEEEEFREVENVLTSHPHGDSDSLQGDPELQEAKKAYNAALAASSTDKAPIWSPDQDGSGNNFTNGHAPQESKKNVPLNWRDGFEPTGD